MSLFVEVYVGSKDNKIPVAAIVAHNVSNLADLSDYDYVREEYGNKQLDIPASQVQGTIYNHNRNQSVWALVQRMLAGVQGKS